MCLLMTCLHCQLFLVLYFPLHEKDGLKEDNVMNIMYLLGSTFQHYLPFSFNRFHTCVYSMYAVETLEKCTHFQWKMLKLLPTILLQQKFYWQRKLQYYSQHKISAYVKKYNCLIQHKKRKKKVNKLGSILLQL